MQAAPAIEFDGKVKGTNDFSEMEGSEVVVVAAGVGRKPGMTCFDLMNLNSEIVKSVVKEIVRYAPESPKNVTYFFAKHVCRARIDYGLILLNFKFGRVLRNLSIVRLLCRARFFCCDLCSIR